MTEVQARIEYVEPGHRDFVAAGPQQRVAQWARTFAERPDAVAAWRPEPDPARPGWATVRVRLRDPAPAPRVRNPAVRLTVQSVWPPERRPAGPEVREWPTTAGMVVLGAASLAAVGGLVWLIVAAVRGAAAWAAGHVGPIVLVLLVAIGAGMLWATSRRERRTAPQRHTCPGINLHCPSCGGRE